MKCNNKTRVLAVISFVAFVLFGCIACNQNSIIRYGSLSVSIDDSNPRTISPSSGDLEFSYYIIYGVHLNGDTFEKQIDTKENYIDNLREGQWSFHVDGYNPNGIKIGTTDDVNVLIYPGENTKVVFTEHYLTSGSGFFRFSIAIPEGDISVATLEVKVRNSNGFNNAYSSNTYQTYSYTRWDAYEDGAGYSVFSDILSIGVGDREVIFNMYDQNGIQLSPPLQEIVQIHNELTSSMSYAWLKEFIPAVSEPSFSRESNINSTDTPYVDGTKLYLYSTYSGSTIYYTIDGRTTPTPEALLYSNPITLDRNMTVKAIAVKDGLVSSSVVTKRYKVVVQTPVITVLSSPFTNDSSQYVVITCGTEDAILHYRFDGNAASSSDPVYSEPILIDSSNTYDHGSTIKVSVYAEKSGLESTSITEQKTVIPSAGFDYTDPAPIRTLSISMPDYAYGFDAIGSGDSIDVVATLSGNSSGVQYEWFLDNEPIHPEYYSNNTLHLGPSDSDSVFFEPDEIHIISVKCTVDGILYTAYQTIKTVISIPVITCYEENGVSYISITSSGNSIIHYTTNGNTPSVSSTVYSGPLQLSTDYSSYSIKAIAVKEGYKNSGIASSQYFRVTLNYKKSPSSSDYTCYKYMLKDSTLYFHIIETSNYSGDLKLEWKNSSGSIIKTDYVTISNYCSFTGIWGGYSVGSVGPSGGYIFYDKGSYSDGWRYLEAAPYDLSTTYRFGYYKTSSSYTTAYTCDTSDGIGYGLTNTDNLVSYMGTTKGYPYTSTGYSAITNYAARMCSQYTMTSSINGKTYNDWFLPSLTELSYMYSNLKAKGLGSFSVGSYWSSTESGSTYAYYYNFSSGFSDSAARSTNYYVRPARRF